MMRKFTLVLILLISFPAFSDHHGDVTAGSGAFVALMVQAKDSDAYITMLKNNPAPFKAIGSSVAGGWCLRHQDWARLSRTNVHF